MTLLLLLFFWPLLQSYNLTLEKIANIWRIEPVWIGAIKFEVARIQFLI